MNPINSFEKALQFTLKWEGGYSDHPEDTGGPTNFGITQATYDEFRKQAGLKLQSVRLIHELEAKQIYLNFFWNPIYAGALPEKLAIAYFDWAVNTGPNRAIKHLQGCLGVAQDGVIGPITLKAMGRAGVDVLSCFLAKREAYYRQIGKGKNKVFLKGWLNRLEDLKKYLGF